MIHATKKSMEELGDKLEAEEKSTIEAAIADLEEAIKGDNKDQIEAKTKTLSEASSKMAERLYAKEGAEAGAAADTGAEAGKASDDDVVDAEFEEVKDDKK